MKSLVLLLVILIFFQLLSLFIYSFGFFIMRVSSVKHASENDIPLKDGQRISPKKQFDRLVFMIVDALRYDFVYNESSGFEFVKQYFSFTFRKIESKHTRAFIALGQAPSVTRPRVRALLSGCVPGFLDFIMNLGSQSLADDNWITQMKLDGRRIKFYGDNTWLGLFPDHFSEYDPVWSFVISETELVDKAVSRHLPDAIQAEDWDTLILYYMGLDHIGHSEGPHSSKMLPKQREMDDVVRLVYETLEKKDIVDGKKSLLLLCGDHGMTESGNHGGSTFNEIASAAVFLSPHFASVASSSNIREIDQVDLVPTISLLFDLPIPLGNTGNVIKEFFEDDPDSLWAALYYNSHQIYHLLNSEFNLEPVELSSEEQSSCLNLKKKQQILSCLKTMNQKIKENSSNLELYEKAY